MSRDEAFEQCAEAFVAGDYDRCVGHLWPLVQDDTTLHTLQLFLICLQRLGRDELLDQAGPQSLEIAAAHSWEQALLRLTLGQVEPTEVLEQATDAVRRCQAWYYTGARLLTRFEVEQAQHVLAECAVQECPCLECLLAQHEVTRLGNSPASALTAEVERRVEQCNRQVVRLGQEEHFDQAVLVATKALAWARQYLGGRHRSLADSLHNLAWLYKTKGNYARAELMLLQAVEIHRAALGDRNQDVATGLHNLADLYRTTGQYGRAEPLYRQALEVRRAALGANHPDVVTSLNNLALLYHSGGDYARAEPLLLEALEACRTALGEKHTEVAAALNNLGLLYHSRGDYARAEPLFLQALEVRRAAVGERHPSFATVLGNLALLSQSRGDYTRAEQLYLQALEILRAALPENHPDVAVSLGNLGVLYQAMGAYARAEPYFRQALEVYRAGVGERHPSIGTGLSNLAMLYLSMGDYARAEPLYLQALEFQQATLGPNHPDVAVALGSLAGLYQTTGDYARAEPLFLRALEVTRVVVGEQHVHFATGLNNLAMMYGTRGEYARAEPLFCRALEVYRTALGEKHPNFALGLNNLAELYRETRDYQRAEPLHNQAIEVWRAALGERHPDFAFGLSNLALLHEAKGDRARAESLHRQALEVRRGALGEGHPDVATSLSNLALLYQYAGDYARAEPLHRQALEVRRAALGENHPDVANSLNNLAALYAATGDQARAEPLHRQALEVCRAALGEDHPDVAVSLHNLALLWAARDRPQEAFDLLRQAAAIDDRLIGQLFAIASDRQRAAFLQQVQKQLAILLSLVRRSLSGSPEAVRTALDVVLRRKAIRAEADTVRRRTVLTGADPHLQTQMQEFYMLSAQIARKALAGPGPEGPDAHQRLLAEWEARREELERTLARRIPEMNLERQLRAADRRAVALALPEGVALIEFVRFEGFDFTAVARQIDERLWEPPHCWRPARYLAFVLRGGEPDDVAMIDLGEAEPMDRLIADFRADLVHDGQAVVRRELVGRRREGGPAATRTLGEPLRAAVFDPVCSALGGRRQLLLSPDGALAFLPFGVLPAGADRLLLDEYSISYVNTGRDVLRFAAPASGQAGKPLVVADPDFDLDDRVVSSPPVSGVGVPALAGRGEPADRLKPGLQPAGRLSRDFDRGYRFHRLPGFRAEGERVAALLGVKPWLGAGALEGRLKRACRSPRLLHLATHGFFLKDQPHDPDRDFRELTVSGDPGRLRGPLPENPLLRAGLALAGANTWLRGGSPPADAEDGLLTAEDVSGFHLLDTELAVLSACQTGLGDVQSGEGVFGLQRAFILAGARTVVMSLWEVPDDATCALMEDFYRRLTNGEPRAAALEAAQQDLRRTHPEPYFWGAFVCLGNPGPLPPTPPGNSPRGEA
jgi:CHAT domain-containing protein/tetratricopeptide (TPR) repeat protein